MGTLNIIGCLLQERLAEIEAEKAAKKLTAHQAAEQKLKEAAMPPRMQLAAQVGITSTSSRPRPHTTSPFACIRSCLARAYLTAPTCFACGTCACNLACQ